MNISEFGRSTTTECGGISETLQTAVAQRARRMEQHFTEIGHEKWAVLDVQLTEQSLVRCLVVRSVREAGISYWIGPLDDPIITLCDTAKAARRMGPHEYKSDLEMFNYLVDNAQGLPDLEE
jgi:hypothetical protein